VLSPFAIGPYGIGVHNGGGRPQAPSPLRNRHTLAELIQLDDRATVPPDVFKAG
jgi:hypothetical protein